MSIVVELSGRKALPLWAIPYVTRGELSADMLLERLADPTYYSPHFPHAFTWRESDNQPIPSKPEKYKRLYVEVKALDEKLDSTATGYLSYQRGAAGIIKTHSQGEYIWLDEFQKWFNKQHYAHVKFKINVHDDIIEHPGVTLDLAPWIPEETLAVNSTGNDSDVSGHKQCGNEENMADNSSCKVEAIFIQGNSNGLGFSGLLNIPQKKDDWFQLIDDMTKDYFNQNGAIPNKIQAWGKMCSATPIGYEITRTKFMGEECLQMPGANPLSQSAFNKRWGKYTANNAQ